MRLARHDQAAMVPNYAFQPTRLRRAAERGRWAS